MDEVDEVPKPLECRVPLSTFRRPPLPPLWCVDADLTSLVGVGLPSIDKR